MIIVETLEKAQEVLSSTDRTIVCFMARWCPPCRMINLSFEEFELQNPNVPIYKIDVHQFKDLTDKLDAKSVPVTFFVDQGHIVSSYKGFLDADELAKIYYNIE